MVLVPLVVRRKSSAGTGKYFGIITSLFHSSILKVLAALLNLFVYLNEKNNDLFMQLN